MARGQSGYPRTEPMLHVFGLALPETLRHLAEEMQRSRALLDLPDDWDEEGSPAYAETTWLRAAGFLAENASRLWEEYGVVIEAPRIRKGPEGSIDLDWRTPRRELLINVPTAPEEPAAYYGDDGSGGHSIKGTLDTSARNQWLLMWLAE
jgi:hypothetical protein